MRKKYTERPNVGGICIWRRSGDPSLIGCVVKGHITEATNL